MFASRKRIQRPSGSLRKTDNVGPARRWAGAHAADLRRLGKARAQNRHRNAGQVKVEKNSRVHEKGACKELAHVLPWNPSEHAGVPQFAILLLFPADVTEHTRMDVPSDIGHVVDMLTGNKPDDLASRLSEHHAPQSRSRKPDPR
jgi:hypothetical protein